MVLDEIVRIHTDLVDKGIFPKRVYLHKEDALRLYEELDRQVLRIHTLTIIITNKHGIWCD